ncbi:hypothetical protein CICLE_v10002432mg [Citrus x clementina]|uniref:ADP-ribosyl cyclase/cyclic ADP-ribose hydrolase n=1 Tax=Citrus clementina TaxID=85681 RepID=V4SW49_CITCL|nr:hypothetical protein CICLE_v10002432mg [Citrus x clementina]
MAASHTSSSSTHHQILQTKYDVFLSFRGEDTRNNFTDHLHAALIRNGFVAFKDDETLERGNEISSELSKAIEESNVSIVILSKNYASSPWCLDELAKIVECGNKKKDRKVFAVFYGVDPADVRKQKGEDFERVFAKYEEEFKENQEKVLKWRAALTRVASLAGLHLQDRSCFPLGRIIRSYKKKILWQNSICRTSKALVQFPKSHYNYIFAVGLYNHT